MVQKGVFKKFGKSVLCYFFIFLIVKTNDDEDDDDVRWADTAEERERAMQLT